MIDNSDPRLITGVYPTNLSAFLICLLFKGLRLTAGRRPSNNFWLMVWEDWAEILRANPGRAMLNWGSHNAQCLPSLYGSSLGLCWAQVVPMLGQVGPMLSHFASWAYVGPSRAHVEPSGPSWAYMAILCQLGWCHDCLAGGRRPRSPCPCRRPSVVTESYLKAWAYVGPMLAHVEPSWELCWGHVWLKLFSFLRKFATSCGQRARLPSTSCIALWCIRSSKTPPNFVPKT